MEIAPDGSPVALYLRLPARTDEARLLHALLPPGATVLDLGCGTGRLAEPLAGLGHPVTAVDNEPAMLGALRLATGVLGDIVGLDLGTRFDAVLLMSHIVNHVDERFVAAALGTTARHLRPGGLALIERHAPGWVATCTEFSSERDGIRYTLHSLERRGGILDATIRYEFDGHRFDQSFSAREVDDGRLAALAANAGLRLVSTVDSRASLALLTPAGTSPGDEGSFVQPIG